MKDQAADKRSPIIAGALILTAVFLGLFGWLLSQTDACGEGWWLWDRLTCLEPNALGDTFAGAFAPVAFVWLVAAVMLQRNELAAQRQELRETRLVAGQQVEEAKKNVLLIGEQTSLLKQDRERIQHREVDEDIDEMVGILIQKLRNDVSNTYISASSPVQSSSGHMIYDCSVQVSPNRSEYVELEDYSDAIRQMLSKAKFYAADKIKFHHSGSYSYGAALTIVEEINGLKAKASPPKQALLTLRGFDALADMLPKLISIVKEHGLDDDEIPF